MRVSVVFLVSEDKDAIACQNIGVDGGLVVW
jgi:hypothetical protein